MVRIPKRQRLNKPWARLGFFERDRWVRIGWIVFFCSLLEFAFGADLEKEELKIAVSALRKENAELKRANAICKQELTAAGNRLSKLEMKGAGDPYLLADAEEARASKEWKSFLLKALKALHDADEEVRALQKRLSLLLYASQEILKSAQKVDPVKRGFLEGEMRQSDKALTEKAEIGNQAPAFIPAPESSALSAAKVIGVRSDLGVVALAVGHKHGARVGMPFLVLREKKVLATLLLVEVRNDASLAMIEQMEPEKPVREGDIATLRKG